MLSVLATAFDGSTLTQTMTYSSKTSLEALHFYISTFFKRREVALECAEVFGWLTGYCYTDTKVLGGFNTLLCGR